MYHRILVPLDGGGTAECGLHEAIRLAADERASLFLLHVLDDFSLFVEMAAVVNYEGIVKGLRSYGEGILAKARKTAADAGVRADVSLREVTQGRIADVIVDEARKVGCDLIVMGTHGRRGLSRLSIGSESQWVVATSPVPVLLVREKPLELPA